MMSKRLTIAVTCAMLSLGIAEAAAQENPEVYLRAEDQEKARSLNKPCQETDVGHGCWRFNDHLVREVPCKHYKGGGMIEVAPIDQCYKMDEPRRYRGIWIDEFESQGFIPEGTEPPQWPGPDHPPGWEEQLERARAAAIWLDVERAGLEHHFDKGGRRMRIDFIGRKTLYPGYYGLMGMSGSEIIVDRVISLKEME